MIYYKLKVMLFQKTIHLRKVSSVINDLKSLQHEVENFLTQELLYVGHITYDWGKIQEKIEKCKNVIQQNFDYPTGIAYLYETASKMRRSINLGFMVPGTHDFRRDSVDIAMAKETAEKTKKQRKL